MAPRRGADRRRRPRPAGGAPGRAATWADAIEAARIALAAAGMTADRVTVAAAEHAPWHPGRCAAIAVDGTVVGHAGELHPAVLSALELPKRTCAMELDLDAVPAAPVAQARRISDVPAGADRRGAGAWTRAVPAAEVEAALAAGAGDLLESVRALRRVRVGAARRGLSGRWPTS